MVESTAPQHRRPARPVMARVLLLGGHGRLGAAIAARLASPDGSAPGARLDLAAPTRVELGLDPDAPDQAVERWFARWEPAVVVNCIALTDVDRCERDTTLARQLNAGLPDALARAAAASGARLIHFSTDYVFDGALRRPYREDDAAHPLSVYGETKLAGDRAIAEAGCRHWIFRTSWLYGAAHRNISAMLLERASAGRTIRLANDRLGVPNPVQLLADELAHCIGRDTANGDAAIGDATAGIAPAPARSGLYHLSCHGATSWYEFGVAFLREAIRAGRLAAARAPKLEGFAETTLARPAKRPAYSALDPSHYERTFGRTLPDWEAAIATALCGQ